MLGRLKLGTAPAWSMRARQAAMVHWLAEQAIFGDDGSLVGHRGAGALRAGAQRPQPVAVQPGAQGVAAHGVAFGA
ncbi:hypothetical protein ABIB44_003969 [Hymenobacter sp. UYCo722]